MAESRESKTLCSCTRMLEIALKGDREILHYLDMERLISQSAYERINDPQSFLSADDKSCILVTEIKHRVKLNSMNYHKIIGYMSQNEKKYEDILAHLEQEYSNPEKPPGIPGPSGSSGSLNEKIIEPGEELQPENDVTPSIEFQGRLKRVKHIDKGSYPSITLNNRNIVVEVNHQFGTNSTFYRVGVLKEEERVEWGDPSSNDPPMRIHYGSGTNPQVTLNDHNYVVEVHKGKCFDRCFYRLGKVDPETRTLEWVLNKYYDMGLFPKVALNDRNMVVTVFQDNLITKHLNYRIGQINAAGDEIDWQDRKQRIQGINAEAFSLDMNNYGLVVLSYQSIVTNRIYCRVGQVMMSATGPTGSIDWSERSRICKGANPCISANNDYVIQTYQSFHYKHLISNVGVATWSSEFKGIEMTLSHEVSKEKNPKRRVARQHYGKGLHPSIALNDNNQVVEVHEPRVQRNRLHYYIGKLKIENN